MWREVLRIFPRLDPATTRQMEQTLTRRFMNVSRKFGQGLLKVVKGSILGITVSLLAKLLNPLQEVEDRIKALLGQGEDAAELADRFNTTPGQIKRLQAVGQSVGVTPERLNDMMSKYAQAIETAREELKDPTKDKSDSTRLVREFIDEKDLAEGFFKLLQSLKAQGLNQGADARAKSEKTLFGQQQYGASRRLIDTDFPTQFKNAGIPGAEKLNTALTSLQQKAALQNQLAAGRESRELISGSSGINNKMITDMAKSEELRIQRENKNLAAYDDLKKASNGIQEIMTSLNEMMKLVTRGVGMLGELLKKLSESRLFKGFFGGGN